jgi:hypothetical protein
MRSPRREERGNEPWQIWALYSFRTRAHHLCRSVLVCGNGTRNPPITQLLTYMRNEACSIHGVLHALETRPPDRIMFKNPSLSMFAVMQVSE